MKTIKITDATLCKKESSYTFKEKLEIARQLEKLNVDTIEFPEIENPQADILLVRTVASFVKNSVISVYAGIGNNSIENAIEALKDIKNSRICILLPLSPVGMEYTCHKKPSKMIEWIENAVSKAKSGCNDVEFCAEDATRAEEEFLIQAIQAAKRAGANEVTISDIAAEMLPDEFAKFTEKIINVVKLPVGVKCSDKNGLASARALLSVMKGTDCVKTQVNGNIVSLDSFVSLINDCGNRYGINTNLTVTELHRTSKQIQRILQNSSDSKTSAYLLQGDDQGIRLDAKDNKHAVLEASKKLGYDLSDEDLDKVYDAFLHTATKKTVGIRELDAIIASEALQVPATYKLENYVINTGNIFSASAQVTLDKNGKSISGISIGDGPIDAAFAAIEQIIGTHFELGDFQIQTVTEGQEAMGSALVKLRFNGKLYSGTGISTDILNASIRAYLSAVNKIVYEEA